MTSAPTAAPRHADDTQDSMIMYGALVFFMQAGFAMLEAGSVRKGAISNIIFKNFIDAALAGFFFWTIGYGLAYGDGDGSRDAKDEGFLGVGDFALSSTDDDRVAAAYEGWFFQFTFAATAATIVSGCIAERAKLFGYMIVSSILTVWTYPIVVHWVWDAEGWISAFNPSARDKFGYGMIDFAGSGVVHMVGGIAGLVGAIIIGGRKIYRDDGTSYNPMFEKADGTKLKFFGIPARAMGGWAKVEDQVERIEPNSRLFIALGTGILWFGWYGFNCGSALGASKTAARVAVTTTLAASGGVLSGFAAGYLKDATWEVNNGMNGALAGLVSITASCSVVEPTSAFFIGLIGGVVYVVSSYLVYLCGIDDPVGGVSVHGIAGIWGCLSVAIFGEDETIMAAGYSLPDDYTGTDDTAEHFGMRLSGQLLGIFVISSWTVINSLLIFLPLRAIDYLTLLVWKPDADGETSPSCMCIGHGLGLRIHPKTEQLGIDFAEHHSTPAALNDAILNSPKLKGIGFPKAGGEATQEPMPELDIEAPAESEPKLAAELLEVEMTAAPAPVEGGGEEKPEQEAN